MGLFTNRENRRPAAPRPDHGSWGQSPTSLEDELGFLALVPERHRADHELRHAHPLAPDHFFSRDPHRVHADIA